MPGFASDLLLLLLAFATFVKVFNDDADEHVEHEEADEQQERDEVEKAPGVVVPSRLHREHERTPWYEQKCSLKCLNTFLSIVCLLVLPIFNENIYHII